jgi:hypothetical protein
VSCRFAGVGEIITDLPIAIEDFERGSIDFNNLVAVHVFDIPCFPSHLSSP